MSLLLLALAILGADAAPLSHQGRLTDASGTPLNGNTVLVFTLWDAADGGQQQWSSASMSVALQDGYYAVELDNAALVDSLFEQDLWIQIAADGQALGSRQRLHAVPYARNAGAAGNLPSAASPPGTCDATLAGRLYYDTDDKQVYACNSTAWTPVGVSGSVAGQTPSSALASCQAIKSAQPSSVSGRYYIDPLGTGPYAAWCEMTAGLGGWELAINLDTSDGNIRYYRDDAFWTTSSAFGAVTTPFASDFKSPQVFGTPHQELMIVAHQGGTTLGWRVWTLAAEASLQSFLGQGRSRTPAALTGSSTQSSVGSLDSRDAVVRPGGALFVNQEWGSTVSYDLARIRNSVMSGADNQEWGLGMQMDAQNNGQLPHYPGCDAGSTAAWTGYFCMGTDRVCPYDCGSASGGTQGLAYDYAIYVRGPVAPAAANTALLGNSAATSADTCDDLHNQRPSAPTGVYWLDLGGSSAFQTVCDMTTAGGGWTLMMNLDTSDGNVRSYRDDSWWTTSSSFGTPGSALTNDFKSAPVFAHSWGSLLIRAHRENLETAGWRTWALSGTTSFLTRFSTTARSRTGNALTASTTGASVVSMPSQDIIVRPAGNLVINREWGSTVSYDLARIRSDTASGTDNQEWGLGMQMDAQNNSQFPHYPGCDAGTTGAWTSYFCSGDDRLCPYDCGTSSGGTQGLHLDYGLYVK